MKITEITHIPQEIPNLSEQNNFIFPEIKEQLKYKGSFSIADLHINSTTYPNWFWRIMQYIILGIKWKKL